MFKNCYYNKRTNEVHLWEQIKGEDFYTTIPWTPYVYLPIKSGNEDARTISGIPTVKRNFSTYEDYNNFVEANPDAFENKVKDEIQFLAERYHGIPDEDMEIPNLLVYYVDIEVIAYEGFPDFKDPKDPITLISVRNSKTKRTVVFGCDPFSNRDYDNETKRDYDINLKNVRYIKCKDEEEVLKRFFAFMNKYPCDVFSGFNVYGFDIPYIINRTKVLFGEKLGSKFYRRMSPINIVSVWKQKNSDNLNVDMGGLTILDFMDLYKMYGKNLERYSLEYICQKVLKVGKLPNPYSSLNELAERDWNRYVDYNVIDCERVNDLEEKLAYIKMVQTLSLLCKSPMKYYTTQTQLIEGLMLTYYRRNCLCAPNFKGGEKEPFKAAYIKEPQRGLHKWVVDVDISSSYPSHIITLNMSIETFFGRIIRMQENQVVKSVKRRRFEPFKMLRFVDDEWKLIKVEGKSLKKFNIALERGLFAIAPCGSIFSTGKEGVIATVEKTLFFKRKTVKNKRDEFGFMVNNIQGKEKEKYKEKEIENDSLQNAIKIMMNAFYGITSVPYSRYHNIHLAEAITSCGRRTIKRGEEFSNYILNNPSEGILNILNEIDEYKTKKSEKDYIVYIHTDSLFLNLNEFISDNINRYDKWDELLDFEKIEYIKRISKEIENHVNKETFEQTQILDYNSQVSEFKIGFKQEIIAKTMLVVQKSKYAYWLLDKEGVPKDSIEVTGLELIRSETAEAIRPKLKNVMEMIMKNASDKDISNQVNLYKKELNKLDPESLAANIGVNGINKYLGTGKPIKGTPWHVKGVYSYRSLLNELNLKDRYEDIKEGIKAKVVYIKKNPYGAETITFYEWPNEFYKIIQLDSETMIEKFFIKKVETLLEPINKVSILQNNNAYQAFFI